METATDKRLTINAELRANEPETKTPEDSQDNGNTDVKTDDNSDVKTDDSSADKIISGYAIVFNQPSRDLGGFKEIITPEALDGVNFDNVYMLNNHDYSQVLASVKAGTLELKTDDKGLYFKATMPNTSYANDVYEQIKSGNVDACSFGFDTDDDTDEWTKDDGGNITRTINKVKDLFDVSVVAVPAYDDTNVNVDTRSYEKFMDLNKKENKEMTKKLITPNENTETRSFENYIRTHGETRDGITTNGASAVIPQEIITPVFQLNNSRYNLAQYATVKTVSNGSGHYPIATSAQTAVLSTKQELAEIANVGGNMFADVPFDVETRAGKIALSNEVVEDAEVDIVSEIKAQLQQLVDNTDNKHILDLLTGGTFTKVNAQSVDDLKKIYNVSLDPALNKMWLINQSAFNALDTMKDNEGRYLLQPDVTAPSGYTLLGSPVVKVSNNLLPDNADGTSPMIIGDLAQAIVVFRRSQVTAQWDKFDQFSQGLSVIVRNDYKAIDKKAVVNISFGAASK